MNSTLNSKFLETIVAAKKCRLLHDAAPMNGFESERTGGKPIDFRAALQGECRLSIIGEIKKASPSLGLIQPDFHPVQQAKAYEKAGVAAISVLTEEDYFLGSLDHLQQVAAAVSLPVLCKDFIIDARQIDEAYQAGASAVLLITALCDDETLKRFIDRCHELSMSALVEIHDLRELMRALQAGAKIIGINNRDLKTFEVNLVTTERLAGLIPQDRLIVAESGIRTAQDMARVYRAGAQAALIGETLMRATGSVSHCLQNLCQDIPS